MAQDRHKEDLKKLLVFLGRIIHEPENSWFVDEMFSMLSSRNDEKNSLAKIEKYLALDYNIDKFVPLIDFSFVADEYTRECFNADYREMLRNRLGSRGHKIDFSEYCRFSLIIAERALNIYLLLSDKTFLSRAEKIRAGTYCRSQPFLVTLLLPQNKQPWAKVIILADSRSIVR